MTATTPDNLSLSPAAERVALIALEQFAEHGYDAASLNDIAIGAGIRKASLYAHFKGKDELFGVVLVLALEAEHHYVEAQFAGEKSTTAGQEYLANLKTRYTTSNALRFLLRAAFYPPQTLRQPVMSGFESYLASIRHAFQAALARSSPQVSPRASGILTESYMAIIDSLYVELIYGNEDHYERRFKALRYLSRVVDLRLLAEGDA
ncbi:TetR/AcrR family transcriptional regulator [Pseudomonas sp. NPDC089734]|uniref:TetR/AcrR family transcriptional regulator n=1 Tax=Pseudomonas sp. NPDC089734 TaxID=3364469 RepID=UPI0037FC5972